MNPIRIKVEVYQGKVISDKNHLVSYQFTNKELDKFMGDWHADLESNYRTLVVQTIFHGLEVGKTYAFDVTTAGIKGLIYGKIANISKDSRSIVLSESCLYLSHEVVTRVVGPFEKDVVFPK
jgi:hypothetical protein